MPSPRLVEILLTDAERAELEDRDAGLAPVTRRARMIDDWRDLLETWVVDSKGKIRGDKAHDKLVAFGYGGTDRTTRRVLAEIKAQWRLGNTRVHRPWITEPGLWLQYDFADGPLVAGRKLVLLVAWLAWSRYRVVIGSAAEIGDICRLFLRQAHSRWVIVLSRNPQLVWGYGKKAGEISKALRVRVS